MNATESIRISGRALRGNKLRSALTVLGILIGVGSVIVLVAVGNGSSQAVASQIRALGTNTITVSSRGHFGAGPSTTGTQSQTGTITAADVTLLNNRGQAPDVAGAYPVESATADATYSDAEETADVTGTNPGYLAAEDDTVSAGRGLTAADVARRARVAVIGESLAEDLFGTGVDPIGQNIRLGSATFNVVGLLATKSSTTATDANLVAVVPITAAEDELTGYPASYDELVVQSRSSADIDAAEGETEQILAEANDTTIAELPFTVVNEASLLTASDSTNRTFTVLLAAVAAISLLVGGIGVMNIMLVTVTERTREIGIRKAIGAPRSAILGQFLTEAVILSLIGGVAGVAVGLIGTRFTIAGVHPVIEWSAVIEAFAVSLAVGVFFGFYPANRAATLRPIDALRYE